MFMYYLTNSEVQDTRKQNVDWRLSLWGMRDKIISTLNDFCVEATEDNAIDKDDYYSINLWLDKDYIENESRTSAEGSKEFADDLSGIVYMLQELGAYVKVKTYTAGDSELPDTVGINKYSFPYIDSIELNITVTYNLLNKEELLRKGRL